MAPSSNPEKILVINTTPEVTADSSAHKLLIEAFIAEGDSGAPFQLNYKGPMKIHLPKNFKSSLDIPQFIFNYDKNELQMAFSDLEYGIDDQRVRFSY